MSAVIVRHKFEAANGSICSDLLQRIEPLDVKRGIDLYMRDTD